MAAQVPGDGGRGGGGPVTGVQPEAGPVRQPDAEQVLQVRDLSTHFFTDSGVVQAVRHVSFELRAGETLAIVGESGCGKSVTALSILGLVPRPGRVVSGRILLDGRDLLTMSGSELRQVRGRDIAMVFQDPLSSLNPVLRVGYQIEEAMVAHDKVPKAGIAARAVSLLTQVRVPDAARRIRDYPHQFSGGMRQRAMIAMGLANHPKVIIADEPTTALDVTVQAQIIELLRDLNQQTGASVILITHNLGVVAGLCQRVVVMYAGQVVEEGPVEQIFASPQHPYTWSLLRSMPRLDASRHRRLRSIEGLPPDLTALPSGCAFHPRCPVRVDRCFTESPPLNSIGLDSAGPDSAGPDSAGPDRRVACHVTMRRAIAEMHADEAADVRPGAVSEVGPGAAERPAADEPAGLARPLPAGGEGLP